MGLVNNPRTVTATLAAAFVLAAGTPASASAPPAAVSHPPAAAPTTAAGLDRYEHQSLAWKSCVLGPDDATGKELEKAGARCADVIVPLDYADPGGCTITVAVSRIKATDTAHRIGSLLLNTGGPGGQDIGDPPWVHDAMKDVGGRYDIVGMDPRFVGRSTPLDCGWPTGSPFRWAGSDRAGFDRVTAFQRDLADRCRTTNADVLPYITTRNTARDMDVVRGALGERRVSYLGYSYGSYLGEVYSTMFPGRTDRMILDGVIDPSRYGPRLLVGTETANETALSHWAAWAAEHDSAYGLGTTRDAVLGTIDRIQRTATERPLVIGGGSSVSYQLDEHIVPFVVFNGLSDDTEQARRSFASSIRTLEQAAEGRRAEPDADFAEALDFLLKGGDEASAYGSVQTAILCGDVAAPRNPEVYWRDVQRSRELHPLVGPFTNDISPCAFWDRPRERPTVVRHDLPALMVNATGDPRTPYAGATAMHRAWPSSRLVTVDGADRHGIYGAYGNTCADNTVNVYLRTGRLPAADVTCPTTGPTAGTRQPRAGG
ncbi:alpha/beta hydrolase [Streptomyces sp. SID13666]|uniref:alpha/beta hydrolase n=1 Tax=unclassified Streptomyces TaxID=2593676 RepID=UPI0013C16675|nr:MULTISPECIES: alpha/beta hydrolase [unclassified Streptomyces]NEA53099.1 alpha/beta hydrolase [Streptomyces sp. SID13666]NEA69574.1 alpha/beta hydrolase [Streptomyces sp. SID13588]